MTIRFALPIINVLTLSLAACQTPRSTEPGTAVPGTTDRNTAGAATTAPALQGTHWRLVEVQGKAVPPAGEAAEAFILLAAEGRVQGNGSCNTIGGTYELPVTGRITFSNMFSTRKMCAAGMDTETQLLQALETADSYLIIGNELQLIRARMAPLARFTAASR